MNFQPTHGANFPPFASVGTWKNVETLHAEPGLVRCFGTGDIGQTGLAEGWAAPEEAHNWNDGAEAVILLSTQAPKEASVLVVEGAPLVVPTQPHQDVILYVNGLRLGFWRLANPRNVQLRATIEPEHVLIRGGTAGNPRGVLRVAFHLPDSLRLSAIQSDGDDRELGFCFRTLALLPASHES